MSKTHWKKLINPDYLGAYSLDAGNGGYKDIVVTIKKIRHESVVGADGKKEMLPVAYFVENGLKPMVLNVTNMKTLDRLFKSHYVEDWEGKKIQIGVESVKAFGDIMDALRIRSFLPREKADTAKCTSCDSPVTATETLTVPQMLALGQKRFGAVLCASCMKQKEAEKNAAKQRTETAQES